MTLTDPGIAVGARKQVENKIGVGSAQFGMDYGVSNAAGRTPPDEVREILRLAAGEAITVIDTAHGYGSSENAIGNALPSGHSFRIVTKTPELPFPAIGQDARELVGRAFRKSLENLRCGAVYGLLVHNADDLLKEGADSLMDTLHEIRRRGHVEKIGVSVYDASQIDAILSRFQIDLIQLPISIVDQRLLWSGHLGRLAAEKIEIHARSVFLQGLLLMRRGSWPERFRPVFGLLDRFHEFAEQQKLAPVQLALGFVRAIPEISRIICGVNSAAQLRELLSTGATGLRTDAFRSLGSENTSLVDPRLWEE